MNDGVIDNVIRSQIVEDYFYFFENKDIEEIAEILSDDCCLTDWNVGEIIGKDKVVEVFFGIFNSIENIVVDITHIHEDISGILICEMVLHADDEAMLVVDVFEFDNDDKIKALRAYKGN